MSAKSLPGKIWKPFEDAGNALWGGRDHPNPSVPAPPDTVKPVNDALTAQLQNELNIRRSMSLSTTIAGNANPAPTGAPATPNQPSAGQSLLSPAVSNAPGISQPGNAGRASGLGFRSGFGPAADTQLDVQAQQKKNAANLSGLKPGGIFN